MADVGIRHEEAIAADNCSARFGRRAVQGHKFTNNTLVTEFQRRGLSLELQILRQAADRNHGMDSAFFPQAAAAVKDSVGADARSLADRNIALNHSIRSDLHSVAKRSFGAHDCARINLNGHYFEGRF
jgi:hypothetical protein